MLSLFGKSIHIHIHMQDVVLMDIPDYFAMGGCRKAKKTRKIHQLIKIMMKEPVKMAKCKFLPSWKTHFLWVIFMCRDCLKMMMFLQFVKIGKKNFSDSSQGSVVGGLLRNADTKPCLKVFRKAENWVG